MPRKSTARKPPFRSAMATASYIVGKSVFFNDPGSPFYAAIDKKDPRLVVVTGENASGKSFFVRVAAEVLRQRGKLPVSVSIRERTGAGGDGMRKVMMFGDEAEQSTGATSVKVIETAFRNLDRPQGSVLIVDEPELGLSEGYARALGNYLAQQSRQIPKACLGVIVVSHSRPLVEGLMEHAGRTPTHVSVSADEDPEAGLFEWLHSSEERSVGDLLALKDTGFERWRVVNGLLRG